MKAAGVAGLTTTLVSGSVAGDSPSDQINGDFDPLEATVEDIHSAFVTERITVQELVNWYLKRIEAFDETINAVINVNPAIQAQAKEKDAQLAESGPDGPLFGIPTIIKDNYDTGDMPTTGGSVVFKNSVPPDDSYIVKQLREAGALILAKVNLSEMALNGLSTSSLGGQTRNPYALDRTPGGSSGGTGAAIAANLGTIGFGTDTVNSIRSPASACNMVGLRPTRGLVSREGIIPVSETQDTGGPMTRRVADTARALDVVAGYDPNDPVTARSTGNIPNSYTDFLNSDGLEGAKLGALRSVFGEEPVVSIAETALEDMRALGATVVDIEEEFDVSKLIDEMYVAPYELQKNFNEYLDSLGGDAPVDTFEEFVELGEYDVTIEDNLQSALETPPSRGGNPESIPEYLKRLHLQTELAGRLYEIMAGYDLDALVFPHQKNLVVEIGADSQRGRNGFLTSGTGLPGIVVPGGFSSEGVPVGISMIGPEFAEPKLIELAYAYEQGTQHRCPPEDFVEVGE